MNEWVERPRCDTALAWREIHSYFHSKKVPWMLDHLFKSSPDRVDALSFEAPHVFADLSKQLWDERLLGALVRLGCECKLSAHRDALFAGEAVNTTEGRAAMHWLLRAPKHAFASGFPSNAVEAAHAQVHAALDEALLFAEKQRANPNITDIVNIGIGGSDLGPLMVVQALQGSNGARANGQRMHFVSNLDGQHLQAVLAMCKPASTLFLVSSKSFKTPETLANAASAKAWFLGGGQTDVAGHFVALTTNNPAAAAWGIETCFGLWDWVGGRFSLWSSIGLSVALAIGASGFRELLAGAHEMDTHFQTAPMERNLPVVLGLLDVLNRNVHGFTSRCVSPYAQALARLPAFLQQLEMESNGKRVDQHGHTLPFATSPVVWGEPGTNGQHAYFQMLHQGSDTVPVEFIATRRANHTLPGHHKALLANALAQARALMLGHSDAGGHKHFSGNRPSSFLLLDEVTPRSLGALIAMYEHRTFVAGSVWGINSFDQFGVELGKVMAADLEVRMDSGDATGLDASTAGLMRRLIS